MKILITLLSLLFMADIAIGGAAVIFNGPFVKALKDDLKLSETAYILTGTVDPTSSAVDAPLGSILLKTDTGDLYQKLDNGSSTNWERIMANLIEDTTPQLGGNLDVNNNQLVDGATHLLSRRGETNGIYIGDAGNGTSSSNQNVGIGRFALNDITTSGGGNSIIGYQAGDAITTGDRNTGIGLAALGALTTGQGNTGIGWGAGDGITTSAANDRNTFVGYLTDSSVATITNATAIGASAVVDASNKIRFGDAAVTLVEIPTGADIQAASGAVGVNGGLDLNGSTSGTLTIQPAAATTSYTTTWPAAQGGASTALVNNGSGTLSWTSVADTNPMDSQGDIIVGASPTGAFAKLDHAGGAGYVLMSGASTPAWDNSPDIGVGANNDPVLTVTRSTAGATGPGLKLFHDTTTPAADDTVARLQFISDDSGGAETTYATVNGKINDPTAAAEEGVLEIRNQNDGSNALALKLHNLASNSNVGTFYRDNDGVGGAYVTVVHNSTSPADNDTVGGYRWSAQNSVATEHTYGQIDIDASDVTDGTEDARMEILISSNGTNVEAMQITDGTVQANNDDGDSTLRIRTGNNTSLTRMQFGDLSDGDVGYIQYDHTANNMKFLTNAGTVEMTLNSNNDLEFNNRDDASCGTGNHCTNDGDDNGTGETCTNNCTSCVIHSVKWSRDSGSVVDLSFIAEIDPTGAAVTYGCKFTPPVTSGFADVHDATIVCNYSESNVSPTTTVYGGGRANTADNTIQLYLYAASGVSNQEVACSGHFKP